MGQECKSTIFVPDCRFNDVCSREKLSKTKDGVYVINLDDNQGKGAHFVSLFINRYTAVYFDSFWIEYISKTNFTLKTNIMSLDFRLKNRWNKELSFR